MPIVRTITVTCPGCKKELVVNRDSGEILEVRDPLVDDPSGDKFADAMRAAKEKESTLDSLFHSSLGSISKKEQERKSVFEEGLKRAREEGPDAERELRDIDLD